MKQTLITHLTSSNIDAQTPENFRDLNLIKSLVEDRSNTQLSWEGHLRSPASPPVTPQQLNFTGTDPYVFQQPGLKYNYLSEGYPNLTPRLISIGPKNPDNQPATEPRITGTGANCMQFSGSNELPSYQGGIMGRVRDGPGVEFSLRKPGVVTTVGTWLAGKMEGHVKFYCEDSEKQIFEGDFRGDLAHGFCEGINSDYSKDLYCSGSWKDGRPNVSVEHPEFKIYKRRPGGLMDPSSFFAFTPRMGAGAYLELEELKHREFYLLYKGSVVGGKRQGEGTEYLPNGDVKFAGNWYNDRINQQAARIYSMKDHFSKYLEYDGDVLNGTYHGLGRLYTYGVG
jgi:hypothetical protein